MNDILTLQISNPTLKEQLKNILSLMKGVRIISTDSSHKIVKEEVPNATTQAAMQETLTGNDAGCVCVDSLESFMASMEE